MSAANDPKPQDKPESGSSTHLTSEERRKRINEAGSPLPGDEQRAEGEDPHEDDALDTGTSDGTTHVD